jgi:hypothetical protein
MKALDRLPKRPLQFAGVQSMHGVSHAPSAVCRSSRWCSRRCDSGASGRMTMCTVGREPLARLEVGLARHVAGHQCTHQQGSPTATDGSQLGSARCRPRGLQVFACDHGAKCQRLVHGPGLCIHLHRHRHIHTAARTFGATQATSTSTRLPADMPAPAWVASWRICVCQSCTEVSCSGSTSGRAQKGPAQTPTQVGTSSRSHRQPKIVDLRHVRCRRVRAEQHERGRRGS